MNVTPNPGHGSPHDNGETANLVLGSAFRTARDREHDQLSHKLTMGLIAVLAVLTSLGYFLHFRNFYLPDSPSYVIPAANMLAGHGFSGSDGKPETVRTPGYPLLILPFLWAKLELKYLVVLQHAIRIFIILAISAFSLHVSHSRRLTFLIGIFLCFDLPMLEAANAILTETFYTAVLLLAIWLLWTPAEGNWWHPALSGLFAGVSVLIRPVGLFLFVPATLYLVLSRRSSRMKGVLAFLIAFALFPFAWTARNYCETGYFTVTSITGVNMLLYRAAGVLAIRDGGDFHINLLTHQAELQEEACSDLHRMGKECFSTFAPPPQQSDYYARLGRRIVVENPAAYVRLAVRGAAVMMLDGGPASLSGLSGITPSIAIRVLMIYTLPIFCLALVGLQRLWGRNRRLFYLSFLVIAYFVIISSGAEANSRLRVPIEPIYGLLAAVGADDILRSVFPPA